MIKLKNVSFSYGNTQKGSGLRDISLTIMPGEVVLLCGESGCGKTTLTRLINGLIPNYYEGNLTGEVYVKEKNISTVPLYETAEIVGSVFQNPRSQFFNVDTTSELAFGCENMGLPQEEICLRIQDTVDEFNMEYLMDRSIFALSGGEKQKIACGSVSTLRPDVFVLDEPSSNLDVCAVEELRKMLTVWKSKGKTIVIAEHRLYYLRELADRIIYMQKGQISREFTAEEFASLTPKELATLGLRPLTLESIADNRAVCIEHMDVISLANFSFAYRNHQDTLQIHKVDLPQTGIIAVIGSNGAGKSTLARCLCGLEKNCRGKMTIENTSYSTRDRLKTCYMVMQDVNHQLFTESVLDEVLLSMNEENSEMAQTVLAGLDLCECKELHPMALSGGQKQRVAIACAVASKRDVIIFDEPTSGLDLRHMNEVATNLQQLSEMGKTQLVITHDLDLILACCTHVLHLEDGKVIGNYPLDEVGIKRIGKFFNTSPH